MRILGLIPARGGSKGVPGKNIIDLGGRPLLAYTAEAGLGAERLTRVVLSTDSNEIADIGRQYGVDVPFLRPEALAGDTVPSIDVIRHVIETLADEGEQYDALCLLQPTCPYRTASMIDAACDKFIDSDADTLLSVLEIPHQYHPQWALLENTEGDVAWASGEKVPVARRQELLPAYHREGSIYLVKTVEILERNTLYGESIVLFPMDPEASVNIDTMDDLHAARAMLDKMID